MCADMEKWPWYIDMWKMHCKTLWTKWSHFCSKWVVSKCIAQIKFRKVAIYINCYSSYLWGVGLWGTSTFCINSYMLNFIQWTYMSLLIRYSKKGEKTFENLLTAIFPHKAFPGWSCPCTHMDLCYSWSVTAKLGGKWSFRTWAYFPTDFHYWMRSYVPVEKILQRLSW